VPRPRHSDDLFHFSYSIFKIEYIVVKLVLFGLSLFGLYKLVESETGFKFVESPSIRGSSLTTYPGAQTTLPQSDPQ
jgi:hypothetical protein